MTLLPKLKFNLANRRLLFLSSQKAAIYHWQNGELGTSYLFDIDQEGRDNFERYLRETPNTPLCILVDIFEEEYRRETIPHVFGPDRTAILDRKKARLFRDTPYQYTRVQGREESGRRDDRVFLSAITNPAIIDPWTELLDKYKVPMSGIHSLPLFTESLLDEFAEVSDYMLVVSMQSISGLRQTFFHNKEFRISRLVQMPRYGTTPYAPYIQDEVEKIHRYLSSLRLISIDETLDIYFLLTGGLLDELKEKYQDTAMIRYHFLDINEMAKDSGLSINLNTPFSDQYFAHQFFKKRPANYYATAANTRYSFMRRMRISMLAASILLIFAGFVWSGFNFIEGLTLKQSSAAAENKARFYQTRYDIARGRLQKTPVEPVDLKVAVEIVETLKKYKTSPIEMIRMMGRGLNRFPMVKLDNFEWSMGLDPDLDNGKNPPNPGNQGVVGFTNVSNVDSGHLFYQIATIEGHLEPFDGDFRKAIESIDNFAEFLKGGESVYDVSILSLPLDVSSSASLQGNTQVIRSEANFSIKVILGIGNES